MPPFCPADRASALDSVHLTRAASNSSATSAKLCREADTVKALARELSHPNKIEKRPEDILDCHQIGIDRAPTNAPGALSALEHHYHRNVMTTLKSAALESSRVASNGAVRAGSCSTVGRV